MSISNTTFIATDSSNTFTYSGGVLLEASGIFKLTVDTTTDPSFTVPAVGFAFHVPGVGLVARIGDATHAPIVAVVLGVCPTTNGSYNFVAVPRSAWNASTDAAYGTATYTASSSQLAVNPFLIGGTAQAPITASVACSAGIGTAGNYTMSITPAGSMFVDFGLHLGGAIGVTAPVSNIDLGTLTSFDYRGIIHRPEDGSRVAFLRTNGNGGFRIGFYLDANQAVEDGNLADGATITNFTQPSPGLLMATLTYQSDGTTVPVVIAVNTVGGKWVLHGLAADGTHKRDFTFIQKG
jgi:hypothetical protein